MKPNAPWPVGAPSPSSRPRPTAEPRINQTRRRILGLLLEIHGGPADRLRRLRLHLSRRLRLGVAQHLLVALLPLGAFIDQLLHVNGDGLHTLKVANLHALTRRNAEVLQQQLL